MIQSTYDFYFLPVGVDYGTTAGQYASFVKISKINNDINTIGKRIFLTPSSIKTKEEDLVCCDVKIYSKTNNKGIHLNYMWKFSDKCKDENKIVPDSNCKGKNKKESIKKYLESEVKKRFKQNILHKDIGIPIKKPILTIVTDIENAKILCGGATGCSEIPWTQDISLTVISNEAAKQTFGHEMGHQLGWACDEYNYLAWLKQFKVREKLYKNKKILESTGKFDLLPPLTNGCPNPEREGNIGVGFPRCCRTCLEDMGGNTICFLLEPAEDPRHLSNKCGTDKECLGMPFGDKEGNIPKDANIPTPPDPHSIMGYNALGTSVYPLGLKRPLKD